MAQQPGNDAKSSLIGLVNEWYNSCHNIDGQTSIWDNIYKSPAQTPKEEEVAEYIKRLKEIVEKIKDGDLSLDGAGFSVAEKKKMVNWWSAIQTGEVLPLVEHTTPKGKWWATLRCLIPPLPNPYLGGDPNRKEGPVKKTRRRSRTCNRKKKPKGKSKRKKTKKKVNRTKKKKN